MMKLIVSAEDFGKSQEINNATIRGLEAGIVTSISLRVDQQEGTEEAFQYIRRNHNVDVGLHLNLQRELGVGMKWNQNQYGVIEIDTRHLLKSRAFISDIRRATTEQICRFKELGVELLRIDSHHHLHLFPEIIENIIDILAEEGIRGIRFFNQFYVLYTKYAGHGTNEYHRVRAMLDRYNISYPDLFIDLEDAVRRYGRRCLAQALRKIEGGTCELMAHLGLYKLPKGYEQTRRNIEYACLCEDLLNYVARTPSLRLLSWREFLDEKQYSTLGDTYMRS